MEAADRQFGDELRQGFLMLTAAYRRERRTRALTPLEVETLRAVGVIIAALNRHFHLPDPSAPRDARPTRGTAANRPPYLTEEPPPGRLLADPSMRGGPDAKPRQVRD